MTIDVAANRSASKYTTREQLARIAWALGAVLFRLTPRPLFAWRRAILRMFGSRVGNRVHIYPTATITMPWNFSIGDDSSVGERSIVYSLGPITIGSRVTISQGAHLCAGTHDYSDPAFPLLKPPITIEDDVWVCADAFIGPGTRIGKGAIAAARAVVVKDVAAEMIVAGNPAKVVKSRRDP